MPRPSSWLELAAREEHAVRFKPEELIDWLKLEIEVIEKGGYNPSVRDPRNEPRIFRDSISCPNMGLTEKLEPCSHCWLMEFVPANRIHEEDPCQHIPLNEQGDTVASLEAEGRHEEAIELLLAWLKSTVARLEAEVPAT